MLRRLADVIRRQDWFTVAVETLIVVLGVFVGLPVNDMSSRYGSWRHRRCARIPTALGEAPPGPGVKTVRG